MNDYEQKLALLAGTPQGAEMLRALKSQESKTGAARVLTPTITTGHSTAQINGVSFGGASGVSLGLTQPFNVSYTAPTAGDGKWVVIGDPANLIARKANIAAADIADLTTSGNTWTKAQLEEYARGGFAIQRINITVPAVAQYAEQFFIGQVDLGGKYANTPLNGRISADNSPQNFTQLLRIVDFASDPVLIDRTTALFMFVPINSSVQLVVTPAGVRNT